MSASLKLVSINVERSKHLDLVIPFLEAQAPDIVCIQEFCERDISRFENALHTKHVSFVPMTSEKELSGSVAVHGLGIISKFELRDQRRAYYAGREGEIPDTIEGDPATYPLSNRLVLMADIEKDGKSFRVGTTHFTWSADGAATDLQRADMRQLLAGLGTEKAFVLVGDFNAPRGWEMWQYLASRYKDNIPPRYTSSIDPALHRAKGLELMVDGIFSTPDHIVSNVEMVEGVSDHKAIIATVSKD